jgi:D-psicose/D-tagatose/L-ribulose 3-epimerase
MPGQKGRTGGRSVLRAMKYGIYYAYWENEWGGDFIPYIEKAAHLGFDILEVACGDFDRQPDCYFYKLREKADECGVTLTGAYGPRPQHNIGSPAQGVADRAFVFYKNIFRKMQIAGIRSIGGALYSYWPVDFNCDMDKAADFERSAERMKTLADLAGERDITLNMEALNRFEGYLVNTAAEAAAYVRAVGRPNVKIMLDTFHMNIEEDSFADAIRTAGKSLGHLHIGEANRKPPREGRMPWREIAGALREAGYDGAVVMEPFTRMGGQVGRDIKIWRDMAGQVAGGDMDEGAAQSLRFVRRVFDEAHG